MRMPCRCFTSEMHTLLMQSYALSCWAIRQFYDCQCLCFTNEISTPLIAILRLVLLSQSTILWLPMPVFYEWNEHSVKWNFTPSFANFTNRQRHSNSMEFWVDLLFLCLLFCLSCSCFLLVACLAAPDSAACSLGAPWLPINDHNNTWNIIHIYQHHKLQCLKAPYTFPGYPNPLSLSPYLSLQFHQHLNRGSDCGYGNKAIFFDAHQ